MIYLIETLQWVCIYIYYIYYVDRQTGNFQNNFATSMTTSSDFTPCFLSTKNTSKTTNDLPPQTLRLGSKPLFNRDQLVIWVSDQQWTPFRSGHVLNSTRNRSHQLKQPRKTATVDIWRFSESRSVIILPQIYQTCQFHGTNKSLNRMTPPVKAPLARLGHVFSLRPRLRCCGAKKMQRQGVPRPSGCFTQKITQKRWNSFWLVD